MKSCFERAKAGESLLPQGGLWRWLRYALNVPRHHLSAESGAQCIAKPSKGANSRTMACEHFGDNTLSFLVSHKVSLKCYTEVGETALQLDDHLKICCVNWDTPLTTQFRSPTASPCYRGVRAHGYDIV